MHVSKIQSQCGPNPITYSHTADNARCIKNRCGVFTGAEEGEEGGLPINIELKRSFWTGVTNKTENVCLQGVGESIPPTFSLLLLTSQLP